MDSQIIVKYELVDTVSSKHVVTESREEAVGYYDQGWMVYEHHITITIPSPFVST